MRGTILQRGKSKNSYSIVISTKDESGKRKQVWHTIKGNKKDAEKRLSELIAPA